MIKQDANVMALVNVLAHSGILRCKQRGIYPKGLNLVFSFASAYTAPVVLMSQNRQSDEDRTQAMQNHQINVQTAQNLELLQAKLDEVYSQKLNELTELLRQQQTIAATATPQIQIPNYVRFLPSNIAQSPSFVLPTVDEALFTHAAARPQAKEAVSN